MAISIIMPVLNEAATIESRLRSLASARAAGAELIVVDGGGNDATLILAAPLCDHALVAPRGRASQMNAGAAVARGETLLFLHADTALPDDAMPLIAAGLDASGAHWGRFDVRIEGRAALLPVIAAMMNMRSAWTGVATGDQAMFMRRAAFDAVGGFPDIALMEDIAMSKALKRLGPPLRLRAKARTSGRRWDKNGALRTVLLMWRLRLAYALGADPDALAVRYGYRPRRRS